MSARTRSGSLRASLPRMKIRPRVGLERVATTRRRVVLPAPVRTQKREGAAWKVEVDSVQGGEAAVPFFHGLENDGRSGRGHSAYASPSTMRVISTSSALKAARRARYSSSESTPFSYRLSMSAIW